MLHAPFLIRDGEARCEGGEDYLNAMKSRIHIKENTNSERTFQSKSYGSI
jgi:hypothetical protein